MADILHYFIVHAPAKKVFTSLSTAEGLDTWWTQKSSGIPALGREFKLWFGPSHHWRAVVTQCVSDKFFELEMTQADADWQGTKVGFHLEEQAGETRVRFHHTGWPTVNDHYQISSYCWAMYLRVLKRYIEHGERVPYTDRLDV